MKEKILAFLKSKLTGVSESFLSGVADTFSKTVNEEKDIETVFTDGIIETLKFSASQLQIEGDRRASEAQKTALKNFQEKHGLNEDGTPIKKVGRPSKKDVDSDNSDEDEKIPKWAEKFLSDQAELKQKFEAQTQEKTSAALVEKVTKHEKLKDIPASYLKGRNLVPKSEAEIDQLVAGIETDYNGFKQEMAEKGVVLSIPPTGGGQQGEKVTIDTYLDEKFPKEPQGKILIKK
jgi:hypothetical protein